MKHVGKALVRVAQAVEDAHTIHPSVQAKTPARNVGSLCIALLSLSAAVRPLYCSVDDVTSYELRRTREQAIL
jgi:hypothetical protein